MGKQNMGCKLLVTRGLFKKFRTYLRLIRAQPLSVIDGCQMAWSPLAHQGSLKIPNPAGWACEGRREGHLS
jgi:hypothetical protein